MRCFEHVTFLDEVGHHCLTCDEFATGGGVQPLRELSKHVVLGYSKAFESAVLRVDRVPDLVEIPAVVVVKLFQRRFDEDVPHSDVCQYSLLQHDVIWDFCFDRQWFCDRLMQIALSSAAHLLQHLPYPLLHALWRHGQARFELRNESILDCLELLDSLWISARVHRMMMGTQRYQIRRISRIVCGVDDGHLEARNCHALIIDLKKLIHAVQGWAGRPSFHLQSRAQTLVRCDRLDTPNFFSSVLHQLLVRCRRS
ncbi:Uncharacterised protein [Chlamydia trachomatis]|nr:Uncharacterised protein [Chlamydia trachomatis]